MSIENLYDRQYIGYYLQSVGSSDGSDSYAGRGRTLALNWSRNF